MRNFIGWVIGIALFVWAIFSTFSLLSRLGFVVDGLDWSANRAPFSLKIIALEIGKQISQLVTGYRALVHGLVQMLHLPHLPSWVYDVAGVATFSIGRGYWLGNKAAGSYDEYVSNVIKPDISTVAKIQADLQTHPIQKVREMHPILNDPEASMSLPQRFARHEDFFRRQIIYSHVGTLRMYLAGRLCPRAFVSMEDVRFRIMHLSAIIVIYGGLVAIIIAVLFGIDYIYRHFVPT